MLSTVLAFDGVGIVKTLTLRTSVFPGFRLSKARGLDVCEYCLFDVKKKKIDNERSKTHKRLKEHFLIGRNMTKCAHFRGSPLFQATYNIKTEKQTINSTYLVSVRCGRLAETIPISSN